jgi:hypothetical protein
MLAPQVAEAVAELRKAFGDSAVEVTEDGQGGALVVIDRVPLGPPYEQSETWMGFQITHLYPVADVYPLHVRGDLSRIDHGPLGTATSASSFANRASTQLSRASNRRDPESFTALQKVERVLSWLLAK